jgi:hypothetical protein
MMKLKKYDKSLLVKQYKANGMTMRNIQKRTVELDPEGKGLSLGTIQRIISLRDFEPFPSSLCLICAALEISPRSLFVDA